jgi:4-amino-4-deoxy-L-arabinose transferase-like glycosyltransferase
MSKAIRIIFTVLCVAGIAVSFAYHTKTILYRIDNLKAPVHINIEIDKNRMAFLTVIASLNSEETLLQLSSTTEYNETLETVILHTGYGSTDGIPAVKDIFLRVPQEHALETLAAIDNISVFIGNRLFYFSGADILALNRTERDEYVLYRLPGLQYKKSLIAQWINWYGDLNLIIKAVCSFFVYPARYFLTWFFLLCLIFLQKARIAAAYNALTARKSRLWAEIFMLAAIAIAGFLLRFNGYVQGSANGDEYYSAVIASNPQQPFFNIFGDPGNPPFYYICLRVWFIIFGWSEQSGRMFSVLIGTVAIISLYRLVTAFSGKKAALLSTLLMATNTWLIGFSQEIRAYILEVFLVSIVAYRFLIFMRSQTVKNMAWYIIPSILIVNTHYYGILVIMANFLFFLCAAGRHNTFLWKKTVSFLFGNIIIAISLLPFFMYTAFSKAVLDGNFNTWIGKPDLAYTLLSVLVPIVLLLYFYVRKNILRHGSIGRQYGLLDYAVFSTGVIFLFAFLISLARPILIQRYLAVLVPFLFIIPSIVLIELFKNLTFKTNSVPAKFALLAGSIFIHSVMLVGYEAILGGSVDAYQESQAYIIRDAGTHREKRSFEFLPGKEGASNIQADFYGYSQLPYYTPNTQYDVLYINPYYFDDEENTRKQMAEYGIDYENTVKIWVSDSRTILKIYR